MNLILITLFISSIIFFTNNRIKKLNFLSNDKGFKHQKFSGFKNVPLSGGIFLIFTYLVLFYFNSYNFLLLFFLFSIFCVGFISDINLLSSPKLRFLIQSLVIIFFVFLLDIKIQNTKFYALDILLENIYFKYFFSVFCLLVLINGSNFIDGLNGLMLSYFTSIIFIILYLNIYASLGIEKNLIVSLLIILVFLFILNINNKLFMGDSGSLFFGSIFVALICISISQNILSMWTWLTLLSIFYVETTVTLSVRLFRKENFFSSRHELHAYQRLVISTQDHSFPSKVFIMIQCLWTIPAALFSFFYPQYDVYIYLITVTPMIIIFYYYGPRKVA